MQHIAILCALQQEITPFIRHIPALQEMEWPGIARLWQGQHAGKTLTLVLSGIGKVHAAAAAQSVITHYAPDAVFSCGTAGSLDDQYQIGDIVVGQQTVQHDYGFVLPETFLPFTFRLLTKTKTPKFLKEFPADETLLNAAHQRESQWTPRSQVFYSTIVTGDQVIFSSAKRQALAQQFHATAVDMESAAIAQVCLLNHIPFLSIRGISDHADETIPIDTSHIDPNEFVSYASASVGEKFSLLTKAVMYFSQHPSEFVLSVQARQHMKLAAQNSAVFTLTLFHELPANS
ncbi:5'-methylthioadenosine/S-adenosylhomocysteine nucleosidase [candidate division KSB3 bacterium]|uniref:adenosylhomocysteine nucleosidase n=1 Tax=candidate division KSB3 bacterium TaxID=2044937 RepID=A0A9D5JRV7_9BACT|nr:5'-methylthioadenosine/S-adenosylhomocysteine nucleosidase [candidate division KSB3 bacterium]MBD3322990.1 5'-methylthioadenosine/S-adenosylhomocysteine nucleosidase [candidate division KSB3 bacterium]